MNNYPTAEVYEKLYARFLKRDPKELFNEVDVKNKCVVDLCSGGGRLTLAALELGATHVTLVDECYNMIGKVGSAKVNIQNRSVQDFVCDYKTKLYDIAVCQQAINYWFSDVNICNLSEKIVKGGYFIFNTFNKKPLNVPFIKEYMYDGLFHTEINQLIDNVVYHSQYCEGLPPHHTSFRWIERAEYRLTLKKYFSKVREIKLGNTSIWVSKK